MNSKVCVVIPARGGSVRVPGKNLVDYRGKPLIQWSIEYTFSEGHQPVVVTDDIDIKRFAARCDAIVIDEPYELGQEMRLMPVFKWAAGLLKRDIIGLQPTSPMRRPGMIEECQALLRDYDSAIAVSKMPSQFVVDESGSFVNRPLLPTGESLVSSEIDEHYLWCGSLCGMSYPRLLQESFQAFGNVGLIKHDAKYAIDIDWPEDFVKPTVCVVGNSVNLRDCPIGTLIDEHDVVVRVNWYTIDGFEKYSGTKTTHWMLFCSYLEDTLARGHVHSGTIRYHCRGITGLWGRHYGNRAEWEYCLSLLPGWKQAEKIGHRPTAFAVQRWKDDYERFFGHPDDRLKMPTTGLLAVVKAIEKWGVTINIAGFGHRHQTRHGHYYNPKYTPLNDVHDWDAERQLLNEWEEDGIIRRLDW